MWVSVYFCSQPANTNFMLLLWLALITECDVDPGVSACEVFVFCTRQWHCKKCSVSLFVVSGLGKYFSDFLNLFCGQTVKPSEFPIMTNPKIKQGALPLCSRPESSTVRWNVQAGVTQGDAFVVSHPASHVYVTQSACQPSACLPRARWLPSF